MLHKAWLRYWSIMVNVPGCRSLWQCNNVFRLDYNLCLAGANEISVRENESFQFPKNDLFLFWLSLGMIRVSNLWGDIWRKTKLFLDRQWFQEDWMVSFSSNEGCLITPRLCFLPPRRLSSLLTAACVTRCLSSVPACTERGAAFSTNDACLVLLPHRSRYQPRMASTPLFRLF